MTVPADTTTDLPRVLTARHAISIVVGIVIGSGIFLVPREMMAATGRVSTVYARLDHRRSALALRRHELRRGRRPSPARRRRVRLHPRGLWRPSRLPLHLDLGHHRQARVHRHHRRRPHARARQLLRAQLSLAAGLRTSLLVLWSQIAAIAATWLITGLNIVSTRESANVQAALTWLKIILIVGIAIVCFASVRHGSLHNLATVYLGAHGGLTGFMTALIAALWAYDGWSDVSQLAGEVRDPQRSMPLALVGGVFIVAALYMLVQGAIQYILPAAIIATSDRPAADALRVIAGSAGAALVTIGMAVSICATFVGSSLSGARVPFAAARDHLFPRSLAAIHPRFHTPYASLLLQAVISTLLLFFVGKFQALFSLAIVSEWLFYALTASTVFVFRRRDPDRPRPYSVNGYPVTPILFILAALMIIVFSFVTEPRNSIAGAAVILLGVPLYCWMKRTSNSTPKNLSS